MDPDKVADELVEHAWGFEERWRKGHVEPAIEHAKEFSRLYRELDEWLKGGGYVPVRWAAATRRPT